MKLPWEEDEEDTAAAPAAAAAPEGSPAGGIDWAAVIANENKAVLGDANPATAPEEAPAAEAAAAAEPAAAAAASSSKVGVSFDLSDDPEASDGGDGPSDGGPGSGEEEPTAAEPSTVLSMKQGREPEGMTNSQAAVWERAEEYTEANPDLRARAGEYYRDVEDEATKGEYFGTWLFHRRHGFGAYSWKATPDGDGPTYEGEWAHNRPHGTGTYLWRVEDHPALQKAGVRTLDYSGAFTEGRIEGTGRLDWGGDWEINSYEGMLLDGRPHGTGTLEFRQAQEDGPLDFVHTGEFQDGVPHGHGERIWEGREEKFTGQWFKGAMHGHGVYVWGLGTAVYDGQFVDGKRSGHGRIRFYERPEDELWTREYEGNWQNNLKHGPGVLRVRGRAEFRGIWNKNKRVSGSFVMQKSGSTFTDLTAVRREQPVE